MSVYQIQLGGKTIGYEIKSYKRSRSIRLIMRADGSVLATKPKWVTNREVERFIADKAKWILENFAKMQATNDGLNVTGVPSLDDGQYKIYRERARSLLVERLEYFNQSYGFAYKQVTVRNQRSCWGSCSAKGNLNFNYRLLFLPEDVRDYVIVHELCHLKELNHSARFWNLVARVAPDYLGLRKRLREESRFIRLA